jgi:hypothetical protein
MSRAERPSSSAVTPIRAGRPLAGVLAASATLGFVVGLLFPAWHVAIEPAQVIAGIVEYPSANPFGLYETRLWTGWHQILAPLLAAGVPERVLTFLLSGLVAAISFSALTAFAYGLGADAELAIATPFVLGVLNPTSWEFWYPIILLGHGHTYGMAGLAWLVLACGVLATERWAVAALLIGIAPAVHASLGAWLGLLALVCGLARWREVRPHLAAIVRGGAFGASITALSLATHLLCQPASVAADPAVASRYLDGFVRLWDAHRVPGDVTGFGGLVVCIGLIVAVAMLRCARQQIGAATALVLNIYVSCGVLGIALALVQRLVPPEQIPNTLLIAMPARLLNLPALAFVPLLIGVLGRYRSDVLARALLFVLVAAAALRPLFADLALYGLPIVGVATTLVIDRHADRPGAIRIAVIGMLAFAGLRATQLLVPIAWRDAPSFAAMLTAATLGVGASMARTRAISTDGSLARLARRFAEQPLLLQLPLRVALVATLLITVNTASRGFDVRSSRLRDYTSDRALAAASRGHGLLLVAPHISTPQLITRRPVALDPGALDMLPYALAGGPEFERTLRIGYGVEFFAPPPQALHTAVLSGEVVKPIWEQRGGAEWREVATSLGVTDVLVPTKWKLSGVPEVERSAAYALYHVAP